MKKVILILFIIIILLWGWFSYIYFNPQLPISQKVLSMIGITTTTVEINQIDNPASIFCEQNSWTLEIITNLSGWQSGLCHLSDGNICDEWAYFRWQCPSIVKTTQTGSKKNLINKLVLSDKEWIKILDINSNILEAINSTQKLLIPNWINSTPIRYIYFIDDKWIWFFDIINNVEKIDSLPLSQTCQENIYCNKVVGSFSDVNSFLIIGWENDEWGGFNITSWYIYNTNSDTKQYLTKQIVSAIWWRDCELAYNGVNKMIYNLWCDWDTTRSSININNNTIENMNFLHEDDYYKAGGFFFWYNRSKNNQVINLEIFDMFENKIDKPSINEELPLANQYYFDNKNNILVQLWESYCIYLDSNSSKKPLNVNIANFSSVIDTENSLLYINSKTGIQVVDTKNCSVKETLNKTANRIEWFVWQ